MVYALAPHFRHFYTIDPSHTPQKLPSNIKNLTHIRTLFDATLLKSVLKHRVDFVIFRHLLEHINTACEFLNSVVKLVENGAMIYIKIPNAEEIFKNKRFYELSRKHCGYWTKVVLINALAVLGCEFVERLEYYDGQRMGLFFRKTDKSFKQEEVLFYDTSLNEVLNLELRKLEKLSKPFKNVALYGAGGHANSLISYLSEEVYLKIKCAIDKDKRRVGRICKILISSSRIMCLKFRGY